MSLLLSKLHRIALQRWYVLSLSLCYREDFAFHPACNCTVSRHQVVGKLLTAHKRRSLRMTKQYLQQLALSSTSSTAPASSPSAADPTTSKGVQGTEGGATGSAFAQDSSRY